MAGNREWFKDGGANGRERKRIYFTFNTNNGAAINTSLVFGANDMLNASAGGSITNANTGEFIITLSRRDFYNRVIFANATIEDTATGGGALATIGNFTNEGATNSAPLVFKVFTYNSSMALANVANTRIFVEVVVMDKSNTGTGDP